MAPLFNTLRSLDTTPSNWRIRVRVTRMWRTPGNAENQLLRMNMILLDEEDYHVYAVASGPVWEWWQDIINEGQVYVFSDFKTAQAHGRLIPVSSSVVIIFTHETVGQQIVQPDFTIPMHKFELQTISDLYEAVGDFNNNELPIFSTDVIGVVTNIRQVATIPTSFGQRTCFRFMLDDGSNNIEATLWGQQIGNIPWVLQNIVAAPIIMIFASCRMNVYRKKVVVSSIPSSKVYINLAHDAVNLFRERVVNEVNQEPEVDAAAD